MTDKTNTPAPLTGDEIRAAVKHAHNMSGPSDATQPGEYVLAGALALLSKLRAPVATTTDRAMLQSVLQDLENSDSVCPRCGHSDSCADMDVAYMIRDHLKAEVRAPVADERISDEILWSWAEQIMGGKEAHHVGRDRVLRFARAALASAPVAGEAVGEIVLFGGDYKEVSWRKGKMPPEGTKLYAAPQASEAAPLKECRHCGWMCTPNPAPSKAGYPLAAPAENSEFANSENGAYTDVALPPLPEALTLLPGQHGYTDQTLDYFARAAVLADRQQRARDPVIGRITVKGRGRSSVDLDASHVDLPEGEYVIRAALSAQPGAQKGGSE